MQQEVIIEGKTFTLVKIQRSNAGVYRHGDLYLRLGDKKDIQHDLDLHEQMIAHDFPVAKIISQGKYENFLYFIEESLGDMHFGHLFSDDIKKVGEITKENFDTFLNITKRFAIAQLVTSGKQNDIKDFADGIELDMICKELPHENVKIQERFSDVIKNLSVFPFVVTHGDFNPHNLYPKGVIDLESSFYGPAGYDLITNLVHIQHFPASTDYEFYQGYTFTESQKADYLSVFDALYQSMGLPALSLHLNDFEFCRAIWLAVNMHKYPKLQKFRYDLFCEKFLTK